MNLWSKTSSTLILALVVFVGIPTVYVTAQQVSNASKIAEVGGALEEVDSNPTATTTTILEPAIREFSIDKEEKTTRSPHKFIAPKILNGSNIGVLNDSTTEQKMLVGLEDNKIFLSPNRKHIAVITTNRGEGAPYTYIADLEGNVVAGPRVGYFVSWSPSSDNVLLYVSDLRNLDGTGTRIYSLNLSGKYEDLGLPVGTVSADVSINGDIVYARTDQVTDRSNLYIRDSRGKDRILLEGEENIFAWARWSPEGDRIAFLKSDLYLNSNANELWLIDTNNDVQKISNVSWSYPPVWSSDSTKFLFAHDGKIWEYNTEPGFVFQVANISGISFKHPVYSLDEQVIAFSDGEQIWTERGGIVEPVVSMQDQSQDYPVIP